MDEQTFQSKFNELLDKIKDLPDAQRGRFEELANETRERRDRIQQSVSELQESLDYMRLSVKYQVFDLEATRRENVYLRKLIEQANREQQNNPNNAPGRNDNGSGGSGGAGNKRRRRRPDDDNFLEDEAEGSD
jgi:hypothetical protein